MRILLALIASAILLSPALANDPPAASAHSSAPAKPAPAPPKPAASMAASAAATAPAISPAVAKGREEIAEAELSAKIAARLAALRAKQAEKSSHASTAKRRTHNAAPKAAQAAHAVAAVMPLPHGEHWSYEGETGPRNWAKLNADWFKCASGNRQSPIDIRDGMKVDLEQINFDYRPSGFNVVDNGHTIQVGISGGNFITIMGRTYELIQFHFHRPSEERINGRGFEMVAHLVHKDPSGNLAVVAVLIERGKQHPLIQTIWNNLPLEKQEATNPTIVLDMNDLLPNRRDYFTYMGSLTTPPCTEGVLWMVMKEPVQASGSQLALFSRLYPMNARPIQANSGRVIKESN